MFVTHGCVRNSYMIMQWLSAVGTVHFTYVLLAFHGRAVRM